MKNLFTLALLALFFSSTGYGQVTSSQDANPEDVSPTEEQRWFQIELIVFDRNDSGTEHWDNEIEINYSNNWVELTRTENAADEIALDDNSADSASKENPLAFNTLEKSAHALSAQATTLKRKKGYRLLFHEAWQQPVTNSDEATSIIINGGDTYADHRTLEGEIKISVARYLHFSTNLWLNEFELNYGQLQHSAWPELPPIPKLEAATSDIKLNSSIEPESYEFKLQLDETPDQNEAFSTDFESLSGTSYLPTSIIPMQQRRRMRSDEIHYLDHPKMGVIIKIMPLERTI